MDVKPLPSMKTFGPAIKRIRHRPNKRPSSNSHSLQPLC